MKRIILLAILVATIVYAGPPRLIERSWNINDTFDQRDAVEWWKGESVTLCYNLTANGAAEDLAGLTLLWHITEQGVASNLHLVVTGAVGSATGQVSFDLSASNSRLGEDERYDGYIRTYDVSNQLLRVDVVQAITAHDSPYMGDYSPIGPLTDTESDPVWLAAYSSGLDLSTMTNAPSAWTAAADAGVTNVISTDSSVAIGGTTAQPDLSVTGYLAGIVGDMTHDAGFYSFPYAPSSRTLFIDPANAQIGFAGGDEIDFFSNYIGGSWQFEGGIQATSMVVNGQAVLTAESNYVDGDVLPAVGGGAITGLNASALSSGTVSQERMPTEWYPTYTQTVSGTATFAITNGALQLWNVNGAVTNFVWIIPETNGVTPLSIIFNGADTNSITANGISVAGSATTWTNPLFRLVGSYYRETATGGKVWPTVE